MRRVRRINPLILSSPLWIPDPVIPRELGKPPSQSSSSSSSLEMERGKVEVKTYPELSRALHFVLASSKFQGKAGRSWRSFVVFNPVQNLEYWMRLRNLFGLLGNSTLLDLKQGVRDCVQIQYNDLLYLNWTWCIFSSSSQALSASQIQ